jgi:hypothetical protein
MIRPSFLRLAGLMTLVVGPGALAQELPQPQPQAGLSYPQITGELEVNIKFQHNTDAPDASKNKNTLSNEDTEASFGLFLSKEFSVQSTIKLEPVRSGDLDRNRYFSDTGAYIEQLFLQYDAKDFVVYGGKFDLGFGSAWDDAPPIFGFDFAKGFDRSGLSYEFNERIGVGAAYKLETLTWGSHEIGANLFMADDTFLSTRAFTRGFQDPVTGNFAFRNRQSFGGPSNTGTLQSFNLFARGDNFYYLPNLGYNIGYISQKGTGDTLNSDGWVAGLKYGIQLTKEISIVPFAEYAWIRNVGGEQNKVDWLTVATTANWGQWSLSVTGAGRGVSTPDDLDGRTDRLLTGSIGYSFDFGLSLYAGYKTERIDHQTFDTVGALANYKLSF